MNNKYILYKHTTPDNKIYIGITCQKPEKRWLQGKGYCGSWFYREAIEKYGWNNIKHEILAEQILSDQIFALEEYYIRKCHSYLPYYGFNDNVGGSQSRRSILPVRCKTLNMVFPTAKECSLYLGDISSHSVKEACESKYRGRSGKSKDYEFEYAINYSEGETYPTDMQFCDNFPSK